MSDVHVPPSAALAATASESATTAPASDSAPAAAVEDVFNFNVESLAHEDFWRRAREAQDPQEKAFLRQAAEEVRKPCPTCACCQVCTTKLAAAWREIVRQEDKLYDDGVTLRLQKEDFLRRTRALDDYAAHMDGMRLKRKPRKRGAIRQGSQRRSQSEEDDVATATAAKKSKS